ncbi:MAG: von Willebrand factor type A domain-containing protein, partial [Nocardioidaceae bacterium]|nr:von Willebrand factor type A domain-containing protein [Nocardioidaceae bacterium]
MRAKRITGIALLAATTVSLSSCTGPLDVPDDQRSLKSRRTLIDAEKYFRDYESGQSDSASAGGSPLASTRGTASDEAHAVPGLLDDNTFVNAGTSDFVSADRDPLSTFALDVDTGSYTVARTLLRQGVTPPSASIRPEEWVNAFDYADAAPTDTDLGVYVDQGRTATQPDLQTVRIGIRARDVLPVDRPPVNLTLVIDTSGSMDIRARLGLVKSSLALLTENLHA